jgi:hypothetical protein
MVKSFLTWAGTVLATYVGCLILISCFIGLQKTANLNNTITTAAWSVVGIVTGGADDISPSMEKGQKAAAKASDRKA